MAVRDQVEYFKEHMRDDGGFSPNPQEPSNLKYTRCVMHLLASDLFGYTMNTYAMCAAFNL